MCVAIFMDKYDSYSSRLSVGGPVFRGIRYRGTVSANFIPQIRAFPDLSVREVLRAEKKGRTLLKY